MTIRRRESVFQVLITGRQAELSAQPACGTSLIKFICVITIWALMMLILRLFLLVLTREIAAARYLPGTTLSSNGNSSRSTVVMTRIAGFIENVQLQSISRMILLLRCRLPIPHQMSLILQATGQFSGTTLQ